MWAIGMLLAPAMLLMRCCSELRAPFAGVRRHEELDEVVVDTVLRDKAAALGVGHDAVPRRVEADLDHEAVGQLVA